MSSIQSIGEQLDQYLRELDGLTARWRYWLQQMESTTMESMPVRLGSDPTADSQLFQEMGALVASRAAILNEARTIGLPATTLHALAQNLPVWSSHSFRTAFEASRVRLAQLGRYHVATWVFLKESADYCQDSLMLMMSGKKREDFTIDENPPETGGHLLDADL